MLIEKRGGKPIDMGKIFDDPVIAKQFDLIRGFGNSSNSITLSGWLKFADAPVSEHPALFRMPVFQSFIENLLMEEVRPDFQLGALCTLLPLADIPDDPTGRFTPIATDLDFTPLLGHEEWELCLQAEPRIDDAIYDEAVVVLTDRDDTELMIYKFMGKNIALCVRDFASRDGMGFVAGNWYAPVGGRLRQNINRAFDRGRGRLYTKEGKWALLRELNTAKLDDFMCDARDEFLALAADDAAEIPDRYDSRYTYNPILGDYSTMTRREYRKTHYEAMKLALSR